MSTNATPTTKRSVFRRTAVAVMLSATVAGGLGVAGAGTASALPPQCAWLYGQVNSYGYLYDVAVAQGNWTAASGYFSEMQYYASRAKRIGCY